MIIMERTCGSYRCDVFQDGELIGHVDGVNLIQWFVKNSYRYTATFSRFTTKDPMQNQFNIIVDIVFANKRIIIKDARVEWIKNRNQNGTFQASNIEIYNPVQFPRVNHTNLASSIIKEPLS